MKSERRHDLKTNSLARRLEGFPAFLKLHANRLMLGLILILLVILALQYRARTNAKAASDARDNLARAHTDIGALRNGGLARQDVTTQQAADGRNKSMNDAEVALNDVLETTKSDPAMQAAGQLARGDLYLALSMFPELPGATTEPSLRLPHSREEFGKLAEDAYQQVLRTPEAPDLSRNSARFGLAALAENRGEWDAARKWYNAVADDPQAGVLKKIASDRIESMSTTTQPVLLANDAPPPSPTPTPTTNATDFVTPAIPPPSPFMPGPEPHDVIPNQPAPPAPSDPPAPPTLPTQPATTNPAGIRTTYSRPPSTPNLMPAKATTRPTTRPG